MAELNTTVYVCEAGKILMKNEQGWWGLEVRLTGLAGPSGRGATVGALDFHDDSPDVSMMTAVGSMSEANRASFIVAAELGRVDVYRDQFRADPALDVVHELHKQRIIEEIFD